jgi:hypothetical protein
MILAIIMEGISKTATVLSVLMKVYTIPCSDRGYINVMLVLQSCTDSLHILPHTSRETFPAKSDCTCDVSNVKVDEDLDMQVEEELNVKTEEEECIDIKHKVCICIEEEGEEGEEIDTKEDEDVDLKEEVSFDDQMVYMSACLFYDPFHHYLEMSVVFVLFLFYTYVWPGVITPLLRMKIIYRDCFI